MSNNNHIIVVVLNEDNDKNLTLHLKDKGFPMKQVYRVLPHENQYFSYILKDLEIPNYRIGFYTGYLKRGKYLLVINSTESQVKQAQSIFEDVGIKDWEVFYTSEAHHSRSSNFDKVSIYGNEVDNFMLSSLN